MKTPIAARIEQYLHRTTDERLSQKQLAGRLHDRCSRVKLLTLAEKLSKLMNGHREGEVFFAEQEILQALAEELKESPVRLRGLIELPTLIFHPRVSEADRAYFRERAQQYHGTAEWLLSTDAAAHSKSTSTEEIANIHAIQRAAEGVARPVAVLAGDRDLWGAKERDLYGVASLPVLHFVRRPRGLEISERPDVLPLPDPAPPQLHDHDGRRLYLVPELAERVRSIWSASSSDDGADGQSSSDSLLGLLTPERLDGIEIRTGTNPAQARLASVLEREETPTFSALEVLCWLRSEAKLSVVHQPPTFQQLLSEAVAAAFGLASERGGSQRDEPSPALNAAQVASEIEKGRLGKTIAWEHEGRCYVTGDGADAAISALREHCPDLALRQPAFIEHLPRLLRERRNPWVCDAAWLTDLIRGAKLETGVDLQATSRFWRNDAVLRAAEACYRYEVLGDDAKLICRAREQLSHLLTRRFEVQEGSAWILFALRAARRSELIVLSYDADWSNWNLVANLGAGHSLRLRVQRYGIEAATPLRLMSDADFKRLGIGASPQEWHLEGGDLHLQIRELDEVALLEASRPGCARRKADEADAWQAQQDDDA